MIDQLRPMGWILLAMALFAACTAPAVSPTPVGSSGPTDGSAVVASASPDSTQTPTPVPVTRPTPTTSVTRSPSPTHAPARWSKPQRITRMDCYGITATIDDRGGYHVAAVCDGAVRVFTSADGATWTKTSIVPPADRVEMNPQLTLDGDTLYLGTSRLAPEDGGCGDDGLRDLGVYLRTRQLPDGAWSDPVQLGARGDHLQALRVVEGVIHATVVADGGGPVYYESQSGPTFTQSLLPDAISTSLRVGDDGRARIAYATGHRIVYTKVDGDRLVADTVAASKKTNLVSPALVLGPGDRAYLLWTQDRDAGGGCAGVGPGPLDGTYFGTDRDGAWVTQRITRAVGGSALTLDPSTGRVHVIVDDGSLLRYMRLRPDGSWASTKLRGTQGMYESVIRLDPVRGRIVVVTSNGDAIYILTTG